MKLIYCLFCTMLVAMSPASAQTKKLQITSGLQAIIQHTPGSSGVQVLIPGVETIELELSQPIAAGYMIKSADYNFDGMKDFAFVAVNQVSGTQTYDIFLYHPEDKSFETLDLPGGICERFGNVRLSAAQKTLRSSCRSGVKSSTDLFKWTGPFSLELTSSNDNSAETRQESADEKAELKTEKAELRKETRDELLERRKEKREEDDED